MAKQKVTIIGAGNLAWSLIPALQQADIEVVQLISRNASALEEFQSTYPIPRFGQHPTELYPHSDFVFLTVSDAAIAQVADLLPPTQAGILHCSGSVSLEVLQRSKHPNTGVWYPLQSFSKGVLADFEYLPIFLEAQTPLYSQLHDMAVSLSTSVYRLDSEQRKVLHMGAVWVNNFTNLMYQVADGLLEQEEEVDFSVYLPLILGHLEKLKTLPPRQAQTGPAIRGDVATLQKHLYLLEESPTIQQLYKQLSQMINPDLLLS